jgi:hypothetical protein
MPENKGILDPIQTVNAHSSTFRFCWRQVAITVSIRSMNRLPSVLSVLPLISCDRSDIIAQRPFIPDTVIPASTLRARQDQR